MIWPLAAKLTRLLPPEAAHRAAVQALRFGIAPQADLPSMPVRLGGLEFANPLGLAAGFDKNAEAMHGAFKLGFSHVEVGTITPAPQPGNPRPRVFRLAEDGAVINRYGFNSAGRDVALARLQAYQSRRLSQTGILGINIGANKTSTDQPADYYEGARAFSPLADYLTVNISSPNTPGLRDLQDAMRLPDILGAVKTGLREAQSAVPVFVKLAPDLTHEQLIAALDQLAEADIAGVIVTNTTISRPDSLTSPFAEQAGGLSGRPLFHPSNEILCQAHQHLLATGMRQKLWLIGVGGIDSPETLYTKILLGADIAQLYTALALNGPDLPASVITGLAAKLQAEGVKDIADCRGQMRTVAEAVAHAQA